VRFKPVPVLVFLGFLAAIGLAALLFAARESARYAATRRVAATPSAIRLGMTIRRTKGPIAEEDYLMDDIDGLSTSEYRAVNRKGTVIKVEALPRETTDVAFLFDKLVSDGIWDLRNKPPRGDTSTTYSVHIYQLTNGQHGSRDFAFTDPHFWATSGGHEFKIHLDKNKPVPDLLHMSSTSLIEPRYAKIVSDFTNFGTPAFRARIVATQARLRSGS